MTTFVCDRDGAVLEGDCRQVLATLPAGSVHTVVTSPPYFGLRDYGTGAWEGGDPACAHIVGSARNDVGRDTPGGRGGSFRGGDLLAPVVCPACGAGRVDRQIGLEPTPDEFVEALVDVFREVRRVLRDDGTVWLNLGDSYAGGNTASGDGEQRSTLNGKRGHIDNVGMAQRRVVGRFDGAKAKDLIGIPWMVAFALRADGWYLRSDVVWAKPNPMPESVTDRPTRAHEYLFLLSKAPRYFYDAEAIREADGGRASGNGFVRPHRLTGGLADGREEEWTPGGGRNKRDVWTVTSQPFAEAHFATFPPALIEPCILASTSAYGACAECGASWERVVRRARTLDGMPVAAPGAWAGPDAPRRMNDGVGHWRWATISDTLGWRPSCACWDAAYRERATLPHSARKRAQRLASGDWWQRVRAHPGDPRWPVVPCVVLDPFAGAGTAGVVARWYRRDFVGIELSAEYAAMARRRIEREESGAPRRAARPQPPAQTSLDLLAEEAVA